VRIPVLVAFLTLAFAFGGCGGADQGGEDAASLEVIRRSDRLWSQADIPRAVAALELVLESNNKSFAAWYRLGIHRTESSPREAIQTLEEAAALDPEHPGPRFFSGMARLRLSDFAGAETDMNLGYDLAQARLGYSLPETTEAARAGFDAIRRGRNGEAARNFTLALEDDDKNAVLWYLHAKARLGTGALDQALASVERALARDSRFSWAHALKAEIHLHQGSNEAALAEIDKALSLNPNLAAAHFQLGNLRLSESEFRDAILAYWMAVLEDPTVPEHHGMLGNTFLQASRPQGIQHLQHLESLASFLTRRAGGPLAVPR
jgi:tetratricopeptide (TPR) repeat protein